MVKLSYHAGGSFSKWVLAVPRDPVAILELRQYHEGAKTRGQACDRLFGPQRIRARALSDLLATSRSLAIPLQFNPLHRPSLGIRFLADSLELLVR